LIYRVRNSFVVPGRKNGEPGSVEVTVYADSAGELYNKDKGIRFTIPGLKNSDRFTKFYAIASTPLAGGFSGETPVVSDEDKLTAEKELQTKLKAKITEIIHNAASSTDSRLYIPEDGRFITFETKELPVKGSDEKLTISETMTVLAVAFDESQFADMILKDTTMSDRDSTKHITNKDTIAFELIKKDAVKPATDELIQFTLSGDVHIVWDVDTESLKKALAGQPSNTLEPTLGNYPGIKNAKATIRPFWRSSFPNVNAIHILLSTEE